MGFGYDGGDYGVWLECEWVDFILGGRELVRCYVNLYISLICKLAVIERRILLSKIESINTGYSLGTKGNQNHRLEKLNISINHPASVTIGLFPTNPWGIKNRNHQPLPTRNARGTRGILLYPKR